MNKSIYILEDSPEILEILELLFAQENMETKSFSTAADFLEDLKNSAPDLCLLDVMLPDGHGIDICEHIKLDQTTKKIPVIIMTGHAEIEKMKLRSRADDFIAKPFDIQDLLKRVKKLLY